MDYSEALLEQKQREFDQLETRHEEIDGFKVMEEEKQAHLAQALFEQKVGEGDLKAAVRVGWHLFFNHGIDLRN